MNMGRRHPPGTHTRKAHYTSVGICRLGRFCRCSKVRCHWGFYCARYLSSSAQSHLHSGPKAILESTLGSHFFPSRLSICLPLLFLLLNVIDEIKTSPGEKDKAPDSSWSIKTLELLFPPPLYIKACVAVSSPRA